jgi:hypothetical protein
VEVIMAEQTITKSLNVSQVRSLYRALNDDIVNVTAKHMAVIYAVIDLICDSSKDADGNFHPITIKADKIQNIFDVEDEDNNVISMR